MGGQLVFTTHNTSLLESIDPRSVFVIRVDIEGFKDISSFPSIARTQRNNNNRQRYLYGQFDGVPIIGNVGIRDISERFYKGVGERLGPLLSERTVSSHWSSSRSARSCAGTTAAAVR